MIGIKRALQLLTNDSGVQTVKEIMDDINVRFANVTSEPLYAVATLVDPRYRGNLLSASELATAKQWFVDQVESTQLPDDTSTASDDVQQPEPKRPRIDYESASPLDLLDGDLLDGDSTAAQLGQLTAEEEVDAYLRQSNIPHQQCPLSSWKANQLHYVRVAEVARRYLSAPSTSVASKCLFSSAGELYSDSRTRLAPEWAEMLLFVKENMKLA